MVGGVAAALGVVEGPTDSSFHAPVLRRSYLLEIRLRCNVMS